MSIVEKRFLNVLECIQKMGPVRQIDVARELNLSLMTVNKIVNRLLEKELVVISGKYQGGMGRSSNLFILNPDKFLSIGIDINDERMVVSGVKPDGSIVAVKKYEINNEKGAFKSGDVVLDSLEEGFKKFCAENDIDITKVSVIGVAPAGIIDSDSGRCILGTHLGGIYNLNIKKNMEEKIGVPVFVDDPARSLAYYENKLGDGKNKKNFIYIYMGKGIGSGIFINGKIYRGYKGIAGEIGHLITMDKGGKRCRCGNYGCLETIASEESIISQAKSGIIDGVYTRLLDFCGGDLEKIDLLALRRAVEENDKFSINILEHAGTHLGRAVAQLVNIFNPELILLGGPGCVLGKYLIEPVVRVVNNEALNLVKERTQIKTARYEEWQDSVSVGVEAFDVMFDFTYKDYSDFHELLLKQSLRE